MGVVLSAMGCGAVDVSIFLSTLYMDLCCAVVSGPDYDSLGLRSVLAGGVRLTQLFILPSGWSMNGYLEKPGEDKTVMSWMSHWPCVVNGFTLLRAIEEGDENRRYTQS